MVQKSKNSAEDFWLFMSAKNQLECKILAPFLEIAQMIHKGAQLSSMPHGEGG